MQKKPPDDIIVPTITDNDTWNTCPECGKSWKDKIPTKGLLHKTRICNSCMKKIRELK